MNADPSLSLTLVPEPEPNQMAGSLRDERGEEHRFSSWLGLLSLLEAARARACGTPTKANPAS